MDTQLGTLHGIGVGPGDPELVTFKAVRVLTQVDVVFTSAQQRSGKSVALEIVKPHLPPEARVEPLSFAHTFAGVESREAHRANARKVVEVLRRGESAAFLTLGDPMTYSTFTYLLEAVRELEPEVPVEVVPGITSFAAAAAESVTPLAEGDESFAVVSAAKGIANLEKALGAADQVVVMKPYRNCQAVCDLLEAKHLTDNTVYASRCSRPEGMVERGLGAARANGKAYLSLFLVKTKAGTA